MREYYKVWITDDWNDIFVEVEQEFDTYEEAVNFIMAQDDTMEQMDEWSWNDGHDLYEIIPCIDNKEVN